MQAELNHRPAAPPARARVVAATAADIRHALRAGWRDLRRRPALSLFFGLVYALFGVVLLSALMVFDQVWIAIAAGVGFPLVAPFLAAGLYEMSRRFARAQPFTAADILLVVFHQRRRQFGLMAFVVLLFFWLWAYQVRLMLALFLQHQSLLSPGELAAVLFTTADGALFLAVGSLVGTVIASLLYSLTVIAMPLLMDRDLDFVTAMITSVTAVRRSPVVMLAWGAAIGALTLAAAAPALLGVVFVFPLLGHASWHLYERLVTEG